MTNWKQKPVRKKKSFVGAYVSKEIKAQLQRNARKYKTTLSLQIEIALTEYLRDYLRDSQKEKGRAKP